MGSAAINRAQAAYLSLIHLFLYFLVLILGMLRMGILGTLKTLNEILQISMAPLKPCCSILDSTQTLVSLLVFRSRSKNILEVFFILSVAGSRVVGPEFMQTWRTCS